MRLTYFLITSYCLFFYSCDTYGSYDYYIDNNSDSTILVTYVVLNNKINKKVSPHSILILDTFPTNNGIADRREMFLTRYFDTVAITNSNIPIKKNIYLRNNWQYSTEKSKYKNVYTLTIENADLNH